MNSKCLGEIPASSMECGDKRTVLILSGFCQTAGPRFLHLRKSEVSTMNKRNEQTSKSVASKASKILSNPKSIVAQKSVAGSALTQAPNRPKGGKR